MKNIKKKKVEKEEKKKEKANAKKEENKEKMMRVEKKTTIETEENQKKKKIIAKSIFMGLVFSFFIAVFGLILWGNWGYAGIAFLVAFVLIELSFFVKKMLNKSLRIRKMEEVFPDFIELMASNLRAGMTIDKALLLSSRKEFSPLDEEILKMGKDIVTGKEISQALLNMARKIKSEKITKTINVINSGIRSGGNLAILLEQTAMNMRERGFVEKKTSSNVLMYVIFIFFAVSIGAPVLFALSTVLLEVLMSILGNMPSTGAVSSVPNIPFALTSIKLPVSFIVYFSIIFLSIIDILASLLLGLVSKGEEKAGLKYTVPLIFFSLSVFFVVRTVLLAYFSDIA